MFDITFKEVPYHLCGQPHFPCGPCAHLRSSDLKSNHMYAWDLRSPGDGTGYGVCGTRHSAGANGTDEELCAGSIFRYGNGGPDPFEEIDWFMIWCSYHHLGADF